jgi:tRNA G18 (ribose-2'-O)-methylase SpoU
VLVEPIDERSDPRLADYRDLKDADVRRRHGCFVAESREVVRRLLDGGRFRMRSVLLTHAALDSLRDALELTDPGVRVFLAPPDIVRDVVGFNFHRGCIAIAERGREPLLDDLVAPAGPRLLLVLEDVANPDNVGGAFRNAMAFGADGVLISTACTDPLYRKTIRVSVGGSLLVPFARIADWAAGLTRLRGGGYTLVALTPRGGAADIAGLGPRLPGPRRIALLVGAEGGGLSDATLAAADVHVKIAMAPGVDSLNVATACGIALHRFRESAR